MSQALDLTHIYSLRNNFTIIGLTGQIGSGCSDVAEQLVKGFNILDFEDPHKLGFDSKIEGFIHNSFRKYRIIYNYAKVNFQSYSRINYKDVLVMFLLKESFVDFINFLESEDLTSQLTEISKRLESMGMAPNFQNEISDLQALKEKFNFFSEKIKSIEIPSVDLYNFYFDPNFKLFCNDLNSILRKYSRIKRNKLLQIISVNLRKSGKPYIFSEPSAEKIFTIVELINDIIKSHRKFIKKSYDEGKINEERTQIVIDDLRNPIEILFFKQRFAAFYTVAINREDSSRSDALSSKFSTPDTKEIREPFWEEEYKGGKDNEFYKTNISACIQQADIHITFITKEEAKSKNGKLDNTNSDNFISESDPKDNTTPFFDWKMQLLKYVSLIGHPGLVPPSPEERCMQMAYTAKHNSGCISRHVGAAVTDENYSIKAIGWNNTPEGQVPCVLRCAQDLIDPQITSDKKAFTTYEYEDDFRNELIDKFEKPILENDKFLKGRNTCFCFKDLKNSFSKDGKNQVHTRSLHAEENAFLQIAKNGGSVGVKGGKLFTTASPCELCAKKAYQLGIKVIYYIDPYPGISFKHILLTGYKPIDIRLFNGAIGNAYHWLYDPIMSYKDEQTLLLGNKFDDYATRQKKIADNFQKDIINMNIEIDQLKEKIRKLESLK